jgi:hypothetical protein
MAKKTEKLITGGWGWPHDRSWAHQHFFLAIQRQAPEVLRGLRDSVLPIYHQIREITCCEITCPTPIPSDPVLQAAVWGWAEQHHLVGSLDDARPRRNRTRTTGKPKTIAALFDRDDISPVMKFFLGWVLFAAYGTLRAWGDGRRPLAELQWTLPPSDCELMNLTGAIDLDYEAVAMCIQAPEAPPQYHFHAPAYHPFLESREQCVQRVMKDVRRQLEAQLDQDDKVFSDLGGFQPTQRVTAERHFDWLTAFQVQRKPLLQIAKECSPPTTAPSVWQGVRAAAERVIGPGWEGWLWQPPRGRPPKH